MDSAIIAVLYWRTRRRLGGEVIGIDVNPDIPPEGAYTYTYTADGVAVSFQFAHTSRRLLAMIVKWPATAQA